MSHNQISDFCAAACKAAKSEHPYNTSDLCELADKLLVELHPNLNHSVEDPEGVFYYTSESQLLFEKVFQEIELALIQSGLEYDQNSLWVFTKKGQV
jgi:hypothetical protein